MPGKSTKVIELIKKVGLTKTNHQIRTQVNMLKLRVETKLLLELDQVPNKATLNHIQDHRLATKLVALQAQVSVDNNKPTTTTITVNHKPLKCHTQRPN